MRFAPCSKDMRRLHRRADSHRRIDAALEQRPLIRNRTLAMTSTAGRLRRLLNPRSPSNVSGDRQTIRRLFWYLLGKYLEEESSMKCPMVHKIQGDHRRLHFLWGRLFFVTTSAAERLGGWTFNVSFSWFQIKPRVFDRRDGSLPSYAKLFSTTPSLNPQACRGRWAWSMMRLASV